MVHLRTVPSVFHARVIAARLGADGIVTDLRGSTGGPYPIGPVSVWVAEEDEDCASQLLLADDIEAVFTPHPDDEEPSRSRRPLVLGLTLRQLLAVVGLALILTAGMWNRVLG